MKDNPDIAIWRDFTEKPNKSCKILIVGDNGNVSTGKYDIDEDRFISNDPEIVTSKWMPFPNRIEEFVGIRESSYSVIEMVDPNTEEAMGTLGGFLLMTNYNFEVVKTEEDIARLADAFGQYFYEEMINIVKSMSS